MIKVISVVHYLCPLVVFAYTVLAPSDLEPDRTILLMWTALLAFWLLFEHECPFGLVYKKIMNPAYTTGRNMKVPDLVDWYRDLDDACGISSQFMHASFGTLMTCVTASLLLRMSTFRSPRLPDTTVWAFYAAFGLVSFIGASRRKRGLTKFDLGLARLAAGMGLAVLVVLICRDEVNVPHAKNVIQDRR